MGLAQLQKAHHARSIENLQLQLAYIQLHGTHCWGYAVRMSRAKGIARAYPIPAQRDEEHFMGEVAMRALVEATGRNANMYQPNEIRKAEALILAALQANDAGIAVVWN